MNNFEITQKQFSELIRKYLFQHNLSPVTFAELCGVSVSTMRNVLKGKNYNVSTFSAICEGMNLEIKLVKRKD